MNKKALAEALASLREADKHLKAAFKQLEDETDEHSDVATMIFSGKAAMATIEKKLKRK